MRVMRDRMGGPGAVAVVAVVVVVAAVVVVGVAVVVFVAEAGSHRRANSLRATKRKWQN